MDIHLYDIVRHDTTCHNKKEIHNYNTIILKNYIENVDLNL
jgi:hypothetical protein